VAISITGSWEATFQGQDPEFRSTKDRMKGHGAAVAFVVDWCVPQDMGVKPIIGMTLEGLVYMLFAVDEVVFTVMQGRLVYRALK
jgi:hypothetical protein